MKRCPRCQRDLAFSDYHKSAKRPNSIQAYCKECQAAATKRAREADPEKFKSRFKRWIEANPEYHKERVQKWRKENWDRTLKTNAAWVKAHPEYTHRKHTRRRVNLRNAFVENIDRDVLYERDRGLCGICGRKVSRKMMCVDHVVPLAEGGLHSYANVQLAHRRCNSRKGNWAPAQTRMILPC